jgi:erythromycin esterase-like protein
VGLKPPAAIRTLNGVTLLPSRFVLAATIALAAPGLAPRCSNPPDSSDDVVLAAWIDEHAAPLATVDPRAPLDDLAPVADAARDATIIGLGESVHGTAEETTLKHRVLRLLVEQLGVRTIAWEDDWTTGLAIDRYITGGAGDPRALAATMGQQWQNQQVVDVLAWLRDFNTGRADKVRFVGVEYYVTGLAAYDAVDSFVVVRDPGRLAALRRSLDRLRPATADIYDHITWYRSVSDKAPYVAAARRVVQLTRAVAGDEHDLVRAEAIHAAEHIAAFYEHFALSDHDALAFRDRHAADDLHWWANLTGSRIAYWAATPHTAAATHLTIDVSPDPAMRFASTGSYLRRADGARYLSIGFSFDHGATSTGPGQTALQAPPAPDWFEHPLGAAPFDQYVLDLRQPGPRGVQHWLRRPLLTRGLPDRPGSTIHADPAADCFDLVIHRQHVAPATPL